MKSEISLLKMFKLTWKHQSWVFVLSCLGFFIACPVLTLMMVSSWEGTVYYSGGDLLRRFAESLQGKGVLLFACAILGIACISGWNAFSYLHGKTRTDFYHALPLNREKLYLLRVITGLFNYVVPALLGLLLIGVIGMTHGLATPATFKRLGILYVSGLIFYLLLFLTASLAMLLTGRMLVGILGTAVFFGILPLFIFLLRGYMDMFFTTATVNWYDVFWGGAGSAVGAHFKAMTGYGSIFRESGKALLADVALLALCGWIHKIRASQAAEKAMAFNMLGELVLVILSVTAGLLMGLLFRTVEAYRDAWMLFGLVFGTLLTYAVIRMIYHLDIRRIFEGRIQLGITFGLVLVFVSIFRFDLLRYDGTIPRQSAIESIGFGVEGTSRWTYRSGSYAAENMELPCDEETYGLLQRLVTGHEIYKETFLQEDEASNAYTVYVTAYARLHNGGTYSRSFEVYADDVREQLAALYERKDYKEAVFDFLGADREQIVEVLLVEPENRMGGTWDSGDTFTISRKVTNKLLETLQADIAGMGAQTVLEENPVGLLLVEHTYESEGLSFSATTPVYVYPSFTQTLNLLAENHIPLSPLQDVENIREIEIIRETDGASDVTTIRDKQEIEQILPRFCADDFCSMWQYGGTRATVTVEDGQGKLVEYDGVLMSWPRFPSVFPH